MTPPSVTGRDTHRDDSTAVTAPSPDQTTARRRPTAALVAFGLSWLGLALSTYLAYEHFTGSATLACSTDGIVDCLKVTTGRWSSVLGVPVAMYGVAHYLVMVLLTWPARFNERTGTVRLLGAVVGVLAVFGLLYLELFEIGAICLWCTAVHVTAIALFAAVLWWRVTSTGSTGSSQG